MARRKEREKKASSTGYDEIGLLLPGYSINNIISHLKWINISMRYSKVNTGTYRTWVFDLWQENFTIYSLIYSRFLSSSRSLKSSSINHFTVHLLYIVILKSQPNTSLIAENRLERKRRNTHDCSKWAWCWWSRKLHELLLCIKEPLKGTFRSLHCQKEICFSRIVNIRFTVFCWSLLLNSWLGCFTGKTLTCLFWARRTLNLCLTCFFIEKNNPEGLATYMYRMIIKIDGFICISYTSLNAFVVHK